MVIYVIYVYFAAILETLIREIRLSDMSKQFGPKNN